MAGKSEGWCDAACGPTRVCTVEGPGVWTGFGVLGEALMLSPHLLHVKKMILTALQMVSCGSRMEGDRGLVLTAPSMPQVPPAP